MVMRLMLIMRTDGMDLANKFKQFVKPYLDKWMLIAQKDTDITYTEYKELKDIYDGIYKDEHKF